MSEISAVTEAPKSNSDDPEYDGFLLRVRDRFLANIEGGKLPLFTTNAGKTSDASLWQTYFSRFPEDVRQQYDCRSCEIFIRRFGGLVTIDADGKTKPAIWEAQDAPERYRASVQALADSVQKADVTGVFLSSATTWGRPETGIWRHLAVEPPASLVFKRATQTADQAMAEKREDYKTVLAALNEFTPHMLTQALKLLSTDSLYRSEKVLGQAKWLADLQKTHAHAKGKAKTNVLWLAVATAPAGFCHPRSSMIGTLLEDIAAGMTFAEVSRRFAAKMHPLQYQRPQAAPTAGAIAAAEKIIQQMDAAGSLARRYCRVDEVEAIWRPVSLKDAQAKKGGVFGHLTPKSAAATNPDMKIPPVIMTWDKFSRTVLPTAERIEFYARDAKESYTILVTAVNADAPPILQWDREDMRNPVSSYVWHGGSKPEQFGLTGDTFHEVVAVSFYPSMWHGGEESYPHQGKGVTFLLAGAQESRSAGLALFPESLRAEFHGVRSVLEAYSKAGNIEGMGNPSAIGISLHKGSAWNALFRVTSGGQTLEYQLDRWD